MRKTRQKSQATDPVPRTRKALAAVNGMIDVTGKTDPKITRRLRHEWAKVAIAHLTLSRRLYEIGDTEKARTWLHRALYGYRYDRKPRMLLSQAINVALEYGTAEDIAEAFRIAMDFEPDSTTINNQYAQWNTNNGRPAYAITILRNQIKKGVGNLHTLNLLGDAYVKNQQPDSAIDLLEETPARNERTMSILSAAYRQKKQPEKAYAVLTKFLGEVSDIKNVDFIIEYAIACNTMLEFDQTAKFLSYYAALVEDTPALRILLHQADKGLKERGEDLPLLAEQVFG